MWHFSFHLFFPLFASSPGRHISPARVCACCRWPGSGQDQGAGCWKLPIGSPGWLVTLAIVVLEGCAPQPRCGEGHLAHGHGNGISYRNVGFHVEMWSALKMCLSLFFLISVMMRTVFFGLVSACVFEVRSYSRTVWLNHLYFCAVCS